MKVLLINPNLRPFESLFEHFMMIEFTPLSLIPIASFIREKGYNVKILDAFSECLSLRDIRKVIAEYDPQVIGISSPVHYELGGDIAAAAKEYNPGIITVLGGIAPSTMPVEVMENLKTVDYIIRGEGEVPFFRLLRFLQGEGGIERIKGLVYRRSANEIAVNDGKECLEILDPIPFFDDTFFITRRKRSYYFKKRYISLELSRGCPFSCKFCIVKDHFGSHMRYHDPYEVAHGMQRCIEKFGTKVFYFIDSTFTANREVFNEFMREIVKKKIHKAAAIKLMTRVDCVDDDTLHTLKEANCFSIAYGVESHSPEVLDRYDKGLSIERIAETFRRTRKIGIKTTALLIFNQYASPDRAAIEKGIRDLTSFLKRIRPDNLFLSPLIVYPHSPLYDELLAKGALDSRGFIDLFKRRYIPSNYLSQQEIERLILRVYSNVYLNKRVEIFSLGLSRFGNRLLGRLFHEN